MSEEMSGEILHVPDIGQVRNDVSLHFAVPNP